MGRKKKNQDEDLNLIPIDMPENEAEHIESEDTELSETTDFEQLIPDRMESEEKEPPQSDMEQPEEKEWPQSDMEQPEEKKSPQSGEEEPDSKASELFGEYVSNENKWERKNRIRDEKERAKYDKKRAKYKDVDDESYEKLIAGPVHKTFGVLSVMLLLAGIALTVLFVYRLVIAPSYAQVGEKEANLQVDGMATGTDTSKYEQRMTALHGIATPSDLTDTWEEMEFTPATPTDVEPEVEGGSGEAESDTQTQEVQQ